MSKRQSAEAMERRIEKAQRQIFLNGLYVQLYIAKKRRGLPTAGAVWHKERKTVEFVGTDKKVLAEMHGSMKQGGGGEVETMYLTPITEDRLLEECGEERGLAERMLGSGK